MKIVGITGPIKHGKSTLAEAFLKLEPTAQHGESSQVIGEVINAMVAIQEPPADTTDLGAIARWANQLPTALSRVTNQKFAAERLHIESSQLAERSATYEKLLTYITSLSAGKLNPQETVSTHNKDGFRPLLQWIGGFVTTRLERSIWYEELVARAGKAADEGCKLYVIGGVRFHADDVVIHEAGGVVLEINRPDGPQIDPTDPTELARQQVVSDSIIANDGTLHDLKRCANIILHDLQNEALQPAYRASAT